MLEITKTLAIYESEIKLTFTTASGPGGQNVNKLATAVQLRFDVVHSPSLPEDVRRRLITLLGKKITVQGELLIKASCHRTQERNKQDALSRLKVLIKQALIPPKQRKKTKPTFASLQRRLKAKKLQSIKKALRKA